MAAEGSMAEPEIQSSESRVTSASKLNAQAAVFVPVRPNGSMQFVNVTSKNSHMADVTPTQSSVVQVENQPHHRQQLSYNQLYGPVSNQGNYSPGQSPKTSNHLDLHGSNSKEQETKGKLPADAKDAVSASDGSAKKVLNQVEYYFSDLNLATTDLLMRFINKDPEGYVPISVVAAFKKIKTAINTASDLVSILMTSSKLVISDDGHNVKRRLPITESDVEELQSRIVVAENLPEDHSFQNLVKIFSAVGRVRNIRICPPQTPAVNSSASRFMKFDGLYFKNKLHAFVLYESVDGAEKAVAELNDEGNWRSGLQVRSMQKCMAKPNQIRGKKWQQDGQGYVEEDEVSGSDKKKIEKLVDDDSPSCDTHSSEIPGHGRGRGKLRGRGQQFSGSTNEATAIAKQPSGPRMPDGTRGFTLGRGKPLSGAN